MVYTQIATLVVLLILCLRVRSLASNARLVSEYMIYRKSVDLNMLTEFRREGLYRELNKLGRTIHRLRVRNRRLSKIVKNMEASMVRGEHQHMSSGVYIAPDMIYNQDERIQ